MYISTIEIETDLKLLTDCASKMTICAENDTREYFYDTIPPDERADALRTESMNPGCAGKDKEKTVMEQKKKGDKTVGKIVKTAVSGVLCIAERFGLAEQRHRQQQGQNRRHQHGVQQARF